MSSGFPPSSPNSFGDFPNPYQSPSAFSSVGGAPGQGREAAKERVKIPAIILMVLAPFAMILFVVDGAGRVIGMQNPELVPAFGDPNAPGVKEGMMVGNTIGMVVDVLGLILQFVVIVGAYHMMTLKNRTLAFVANLISCVPCLTACCVLGIPIGIWGLVVMNDSAVKQYFES
jgi:hypothetical protein